MKRVWLVVMLAGVSACRKERPSEAAAATAPGAIAGGAGPEAPGAPATLRTRPRVTIRLDGIYLRTRADAARGDVLGKKVVLLNDWRVEEDELLALVAALTEAQKDVFVLEGNRLTAWVDYAIDGRAPFSLGMRAMVAAFTAGLSQLALVVDERVEIPLVAEGRAEASVAITADGWSLDGVKIARHDTAALHGAASRKLVVISVQDDIPWSEVFEVAQAVAPAGITFGAPPAR